MKWNRPTKPNSRKRVTITLDKDLIKYLKNEGFNISWTVEEALKARLPEWTERFRSHKKQTEKPRD